jgi:hypothetical protein
MSHSGNPSNLSGSLPTPSPLATGTNINNNNNNNHSSSGSSSTFSNISSTLKRGSQLKYNALKLYELYVIANPVPSNAITQLQHMQSNSKLALETLQRIAGNEAAVEVISMDSTLQLRPASPTTSAIHNNRNATDNDNGNNDEEMQRRARLARKRKQFMDHMTELRQLRLPALVCKRTQTIYFLNDILRVLKSVDFVSELNCTLLDRVDKLCDIVKSLVELQHQRLLMSTHHNNSGEAVQPPVPPPPQFASLASSFPPAPPATISSKLQFGAAHHATNHQHNQHAQTRPSINGGNNNYYIPPAPVAEPHPAEVNPYYATTHPITPPTLNPYARYRPASFGAAGVPSTSSSLAPLTATPPAFAGSVGSHLYHRFMESDYSEAEHNPYLGHQQRTSYSSSDNDAVNDDESYNQFSHHHFPQQPYANQQGMFSSTMPTTNAPLSRNYGANFISDDSNNNNHQNNNAAHNNNSNYDQNQNNGSGGYSVNDERRREIEELKRFATQLKNSNGAITPPPSRRPSVSVTGKPLVSQPVAEKPNSATKTAVAAPQPQKDIVSQELLNTLFTTPPAAPASSSSSSAAAGTESSSAGNSVEK